ncbi:B9 domain-containing protein 2 [Ctenocephalides felis]|uniref:B9 domain-containing protein 2 n=1 Tax=Ctenocephalides felis TaxID=7515 RepID=UPI000E6E3A55|nr:B9 domain-containing protein 2 [Ctenocephalides felis]
MAELFIIGQIVGASGFNQSTLSCKWHLEAGNAWKVVGGYSEGITKTDQSYGEEEVKWNHPIDVRFATRGLQGWPKFCIEVYSVDIFNRSRVVGYGFMHVPLTPGHHKEVCQTWSLRQSTWESIRQFFLGSPPEEVKPNNFHSGVDRYKLNTQSAGVVSFELNTIFKNFDAYGVEYK